MIKKFSLFSIFYLLICCNFLFCLTSTEIVKSVISVNLVVLANDEIVTLAGLVPVDDININASSVEFLKTLVLNEKMSFVDAVPDKDINGYRAVYMYAGNDMINTQLISLGYALTDKIIEFDKKQNFLNCEKQAQQNKLGLWQTSTANVIENPNKNEVVKARVVVAKKHAAVHPVIGIIATKIYHEPTCKLIRNAKKEEIAAFGYPYHAYENGYKPCPVCNPALSKQKSK